MWKYLNSRIQIPYHDKSTLKKNKHEMHVSILDRTVNKAEKIQECKA